MSFLIFSSKHVFAFVVGTCLCLIFCELFCGCAEEPGRAGWSTAELLVCAPVPVQLSEPPEDGVLCSPAGRGGSAGKSPASSAGGARECHA